MTQSLGTVKLSLQNMFLSDMSQKESFNFTHN